MATTSLNGRTAEAVRREIEAERRELATAVERLRDGLGAALGAGFFLSGGIGATMRYFARRGRER